MKIYRRYRYRLYPTPAQTAILVAQISAARFVYNLALEQRATFGRKGRNFSRFQQAKELTQLRAEVDWLGILTRSNQVNAIHEVDTAFARFFSGKARYPRWRKAGENEKAWFRFVETATKQSGARISHVRLPLADWVRYRDTRALEGRCLHVTVSRRADQWFISFVCEIECAPPESHLPPAGLDRGIANAIALSNGEMLQAPATLAALERRAAKARKSLSRKMRGSRRYARQQARLSRLTARAAGIRADFNHRASSAVASRFGAVGIEDLNIRGMTARGKRGLNRAILAQGWGQFADMLEYKLAERGGRLIKVNAAYTSQTCAVCGHVDSANRKSQAVFQCVSCGHTAHADTNAAIEILRRSTASVEGRRLAPVEARTRAA